MNYTILLLLLTSVCGFSAAMENQPERKLLKIQAGNKEIIVDREHAIACDTIKNLLGDTDLAGILPLHDGALQETLALIQPYFYQAYKKDTVAIAKMLQAHSIAELVEIAQAFDFLASDFVRDAALEVLAARLVKKENLYSCLQDNQGSFNLHLSDYLEAMLAQKMIAQQPKWFKHSLLLKQAELAPAYVELGWQEGSISDFCFSSDGKKFALCSDDSVIRVWNVITGQKIAQFQADKSGHWSRCICFNHDATRIALISNAHIHIWDVATGSKLLTLPGHNYVTAIRFSPDGAKIASFSVDRTIRIWDSATGNQIGQQPLQGNSLDISTICFSPDGSTLASGSWDGTIRLWDVATGNQIGQPLQGHFSRIISVSFSPDGLRLCSAFDDGTICIWDVATGAPIGTPVNEGGRKLRWASFNHDGTLLFSRDFDNKGKVYIRFWDPATGRRIGKSIQISAPFLGISPDGTKIASYDESSNSIKISSVFDKELHQWISTRITPEQLAALIYFDECIRNEQKVDTVRYPGLATIQLPGKFDPVISNAKTITTSWTKKPMTWILGAAAAVGAGYLGYWLYKKS